MRKEGTGALVRTCGVRGHDGLPWRFKGGVDGGDVYEPGDVC